MSFVNCLLMILNLMEILLFFQSMMMATKSLKHLQRCVYAFNARGKATQDPTPHGTLVRELAFGDNSPNVIYLARPCQYVKSPICSKRHWTTARFSPEVINAEYEAIKNIASNNPVILIGFSGGAQVAGLVTTANPLCRQ